MKLRLVADRNVSLDAMWYALCVAMRHSYSGTRYANPDALGPCDHAAARPFASGVSLRRFTDAARPAGGRGVQDRAPSRQDADAADGDRGALSPSAHD